MALDQQRAVKLCGEYRGRTALNLSFQIAILPVRLLS
jgi:hypothetical protein